MFARLTIAAPLLAVLAGAGCDAPNELGPELESLDIADDNLDNALMDDSIAILEEDHGIVLSETAITVDEFTADAETAESGTCLTPAPDGVAPELVASAQGYNVYRFIGYGVPGGACNNACDTWPAAALAAGFNTATSSKYARTVNGHPGLLCYLVTT